MKTRISKRKTLETVAGAAIGAAIGGPVGAVAGGLVASKVDSGVKQSRPGGRTKTRAANFADDPLIHANLKRILVPLDFSPPSKRAMRFARKWAAIFSSEVFLLHVVEPTTMVGEFGTVPIGMIRRDSADKAKAALEKLAHSEFPDSIPVTVAIRKGKAFEQIAAFAHGIHADMVIIATHGYTGLKHVLLGSTAERVVRHAPCPVLVLRRGPRQFTF